MNEEKLSVEASQLSPIKPTIPDIAKKPIYRPITVALDMDGVIADFIGSLFKAYNARYGNRRPILKPVDMTSFFFEDVFDPYTATILTDMMNEKGVFANILPYPGAFDTVYRIINNGCDVQIVTSPPMTMDNFHKSINPIAIVEKLEWIKRHIPILSSRVTFTNRKDLIRTDILIDDGIHNIREWCHKNTGGIGFLIDRPWNVNCIIPYNARRCNLFDVDKDPKFYEPRFHKNRKSWPIKPNASPQPTEKT